MDISYLELVEILYDQFKKIFLESIKYLFFYIVFYLLISGENE